MLTKRIGLLSLLVAASSVAAVAFAAEPPSPRTPQNDPALAARTKWWREDRFGMFIHWGLYAVPAGYYRGKPVDGIGEWIMATANIPIPEYEKFAPQFNPTAFNAREWVRVAKAAGMKYIVITSKHHEGFSMFDTAVNRYDLVDGTPWKHDPMKDLARASKVEGIKFGFYHSIMDWHHPELNGDNVRAEDVDRYVSGQLKPQLRELITKYNPAILWFDGEWVGWWTQERGRDLERFIHALNPKIVINNRIGKRQMNDGDYETPEQEIPASAMGSGRLWETCMTINDTWGYKRDDHNWKPTADLTHKLIDIASKGGNFLLNVGPTDTGVIPAPSVERLREVGAWMKRNGAAIYGTTQSPYRKTPFDGRCTVKGNTLYVHAFSWPEDGLKLTGFKSAVASAKLLDGGAKVGYRLEKQEDGTTTLVLQKPSRLDPLATVVAVSLRGAPQIENVAALIRQDRGGVVTLTATDADVQGHTARLQGTGENANIGYWTNADDQVSWGIQVDRAGRYDVELRYSSDNGSEGATYQVRFAPEVPVNVSTYVIAAEGKTQSTGSWDTYRTERIGQVDLPSGRMVVRVVPQSKPGLAVMNLSQIRLVPVMRAGQ